MQCGVRFYKESFFIGLLSVLAIALEVEDRYGSCLSKQKVLVNGYLIANYKFIKI